MAPTAPKPAAEQTKFTDLLDLDEDSLTAASPLPADDPLSLVRDAKEPESPDLLVEDGVLSLKQGDVVNFHLVTDEYYILNKQYRKGDDLSITVGVGKYARTIDPDGKSWLRFLADDEAQIRRWGRVVFKLGTYAEARVEQIPVPDFVEGEEQAKAWREAVLHAAENFLRTR